MKRALSPASPWLACPKARPAALKRLVCLPHGGGSASAYYALAALLPETIELLAVQLPGRETRLSEPPFTRMPPLVKALADALEPIAERPYAFFGHSFGALLGFEASRELRRRGLPLPETMIASGRRAPTVASSEPPLHKLPDDRFVAELVRRYDAIPRVILDEPELVALFVPILKADFAVLETHVHQGEPPLTCALGLYGGLDDPQTAQMEGWAELVSGSCRRRHFPGGHFYLQRPDQRRPLASALAEDLMALAPAA
ncbi:MAG: thioesterase II family protein [Thiohalocapsa sp.]